MARVAIADGLQRAAGMLDDPTTGECGEMVTRDLEKWLLVPHNKGQLALTIAAFTGLGMAYCVVSKLPTPEMPNLTVAAVWGLVTMLPWLLAAEVLKIRRLRTLVVPYRFVIRLSAVAYVSTVLLQLTLETILLPDQPALWSILVSRTPAAVVFTGLFVLMLNWPVLNKEEAGQPAADDIQKMLLADVIKAAGNYTEIQFGGRSSLVRMPLSRADHLLQDSHTRIHRSTIVRTCAVTRLEPSTGGWVAILSDGSVHRIGETFLPIVRGKIARAGART